MADVTTPGFQKLSILQVPDVGLGGTYPLRFVRRADGAVVEDRAANIAAIVRGFLGAELVESVDYAPEKNPNRCARHARARTQLRLRVQRTASPPRRRR